MFPDRQRGFSIISAIFILVVLSALAGFIATIFTTQQAGAALDVQGAQAYQAARAGTEWGLAQALNSNACLGSSFPNANFTVDTMSVTVECQNPVPVVGDTVEAGLMAIYTITATACNFPQASAPFCPGDASNPYYVERRITVIADTTPI